MNIDELLRAACDLKASDLHLKAGSTPHVRIDGELRALADCPRVSPEETMRFAAAMMTERQQLKFEEANQLDLAYGVAGLGRFRANVFQQRGSVAIAMRVIPTQVYSFEQLHLPPVTGRLADERRGLVLVTGTTGSGKSTTLASMIHRVNCSRPAHIITIEDPIEFLHRDQEGFIDQREVGVDTPDFRLALRAALRQDPDVILLGEMRDTETIQTALVAAETGHAVFSSLHTLDATESIQRIVAAFPPRDQQQIRLQLASTLRGVVSLRLMRRKEGGGRVPAVEIMIATDYIRDCIANPDKTRLISQAIAAGASQYGMQTFDQSIFALYSEGLISIEDALEQASKPDDFKLRIAGISSDSVRIGDEPESIFGGSRIDGR
ncbi:MAG TPA: type IV pilus twitching motility protein PilT [Terriglobia bacterium]|nr:type IV pilus twitching motility protein PilT [Terriglobia bacterium]